MATNTSFIAGSTWWKCGPWLFTHLLELLIMGATKAVLKRIPLYTVQSSEITNYTVSRKECASCCRCRLLKKKTSSQLHKTDAGLPDSLGAEWSERGGGGIHDFPSIADAGNIHIG